MPVFPLTVLRFLKVLRVAGGYGLAGMLGRRKAESKPDRLRRALEVLGGTFVKFGQVMSLQPDVLSPEVCEALFDLLDRVSPFQATEVDKVFREDFGRGPDEIFDDFDYRVVASASIGQVHRARLGDRDLAVKVRRPGVERVFEADLRLMRALAWGIRMFRLNRWIWFARTIEEFDAWTVEELDYRYEARFMATLASHACDNPNEVIPEVLSEFSNGRILVADFLDGPTILDLIRVIDDPVALGGLAPAGFDPQVFAENIVTNFVSDAFHQGLFHADLHPANLLVMPGNVVGYVDFGITGSFSRYSRRNMVALLLAMTRADVESMVTHFMRISTFDSGTDIDAFRSGLQGLVEEWYEPNGDDFRLRTSFTTVMIDLLHLTRRTGVWWTPDVTRYIRSVITADGLVNRFAPGLDVSRLLRETCERFLALEMWRARLAPENLADWASAGVHLFNNGPVIAASLLGPSRGGLQANAGGGNSRRSGSGNARLVLALTAFSAAALVHFHSTETILGFNLLTAELIVAIVACSAFVTTIRR